MDNVRRNVRKPDKRGTLSIFTGRADGYNDSRRARYMRGKEMAA